jgi:uncharacterized repeat protein (TIGR03803 family)
MLALALLFFSCYLTLITSNLITVDPIYSFNSYPGQPLGVIYNSKAYDGYYYTTLASGCNYNQGCIVRFAQTSNITLQYLYHFNCLYDNSTICAGNYQFVQGADKLLYVISPQSSTSIASLIAFNRSDFSVKRIYTYNSLVSGSQPDSHLFLGLDNNLYSITASGGKNNCGCLTRIFKNQSIDSTNIYHFPVSACNPIGSLTQINSLIYGTTIIGGVANFGTIYSYNVSSSKVQVLYSFAGAKAGAYPANGLFLASDDSLYGVTTGSSGYGVLFSFNYHKNNYTKLSNYANNNNLYVSAIIEPVQGLLYFTAGYTAAYNAISNLFQYNLNTKICQSLYSFQRKQSIYSVDLLAIGKSLLVPIYSGGPCNTGQLFNYSIPANVATVIFNFSCDSIGNNPRAELVENSRNPSLLLTSTNAGSKGNTGAIISYDINLGKVSSIFTSNDNRLGVSTYSSVTYSAKDNLYYGVYTKGGNYDQGLIYSLNITSGAARTFIPIISSNETVGSFPYLAPLPSGLNSNYLFGQTTDGSIRSRGAIYRLDVSKSPAKYAIVNDFSSHSMKFSFAQLLESKTTPGIFYTFCYLGGIYTFGELYSFNSLTNVVTPLYNFDNVTSGAYPSSSKFLWASNNLLYACTAAGGKWDLGTLWSFDLSNNKQKIVHSFDGINTGSTPGFTALLQASNGKIYGLTAAGGLFSAGTLFEFDLSTHLVTAVHHFNPQVSGSGPVNNLLQSSLNGRLYGVSSSGCLYSSGCIWQSNPLLSAIFPVPKSVVNGQLLINFPASIEFFIGQVAVNIIPTVSGDAIYRNFSSIYNEYIFHLNNSTRYRIVKTVLLSNQYIWTSSDIDLSNYNVRLTEAGSLSLSMNRKYLTAGTSVTLNLNFTLLANVTLQSDTEQFSQLFIFASVNKDITINVPAAPKQTLSTAKSVTVTPNAGGLAVIDLFNISMKGFINPITNNSQGLFYSFLCNNLKNNQTIDLNGKLSPISYITSYFPSGQFTLFISIYTIAGGVTSIQTSFIVEPINFNCSYANLLLDRIESDLLNNNSLALLEDIYTLANEINFDLLSNLTTDVDIQLANQVDFLNSFALLQASCILYSNQYQLVYSSSIQMYLLTILDEVLNNPAIFFSSTQLSQLFNILTNNVGRSFELIHYYSINPLHSASVNNLLTSEQLIKDIQLTISSINQNQPNLYESNDVSNVVSSNIAISLSNILANSNTRCSLLPDLINTVRLLVTSTNNATGIAGSSAIDYKTQQFHLVFKRLFIKVTNYNSNPTLIDQSTGQPLVRFPVDALTNLPELMNSSYIDILAIQHNKQLQQCFNSITATNSIIDQYEHDIENCVNDGSKKENNLLTSIYEIIILNELGQLVSVNNLTDPTELGLPLLLDGNQTTSIDINSIHCSYYDFTLNEWLSTGIITVIDPSTGKVTCQSNHLTPFALLYYNNEQSLQGCTSLSQKVIYIVFSVIYFILLLILSIQLFRLVFSQYLLNRRISMNLLAYQHLLMFLLCLVRALSLISNSLPNSSTFAASNLPLFVNGVISLILPFTLFFFCFTLILFGWIGIYHFNMRSDAPTLLKPAVYVINIIIFIIFIILLALMNSAKDNNNLSKQIITAGTVILAIITLIIAIGFNVYGILLCRQLSAVQKLNSNKSVNHSAAVRRMFIVAQLFSFCFSIVAILQLITAINLDEFYSNLSIFLAVTYSFDLVCVLLVILLFKQAVDSMAKEASRLSDTSQRTNNRITRTSKLVSENSVNTSRSRIAPTEEYPAKSSISMEPSHINIYLSPKNKLSVG